jgi:dipeptidyl aminopeptidase/acylaminoacyl peptidase
MSLPRIFRRGRAACLSLALTLLASPDSAQSQTRAVSLDDLVNMVRFSVRDLSADGRWIVATSGTMKDGFGDQSGTFRYGDLTYTFNAPTDVWIIDTKTGDKKKLFNDRRALGGGRGGGGLTWSPDGNTLALTQVVNDVTTPMLWDRASGKFKTISIPTGYFIDGPMTWSEDGKRLYLTLRTEEWRKRSKVIFDSLVNGPIVVLDSKDPFLEWDALGNRGDIKALAAYDLAGGKTNIVLPEGIYTGVNVSLDGTIIRTTESNVNKTMYDGGRWTNNDSKIWVRPADGSSAARVLIPSTKGFTVSWAKDGKHYGYAKDSSVYIASITDEKPRQMKGSKFVWAPEGLSYAYMNSDSTLVVGRFGEAEKSITLHPNRRSSDPAPSDTAAKSKAKLKAMAFTPSQLSKSGRFVILNNRDGQWLVDTESSDATLFVKYPEADDERPNVSIAFWSPDEKSVFYTKSSTIKWDRGLSRYDIAEKKETVVFHDGEKRHGQFRASKDGSTILFTISNGYLPGDYYVSDLSFSSPKQISDVNPWMRERKWGKTELLEYLNADGKKLKGVVYYPVDYQPGKAYPTVFEIYETMFDDRFSELVSYLNANGYVVCMPSVSLEMGWPVEAWIKGVTAAANKLIEMGVTDSARMGVEGGSYGGYATNLLITQTDRFKAAINISGKTDMISFYTDSPRLGVRNIWAPEGQQDRLGGTFWQMPLRYLEHSAVYYADRIDTPLMLVTGMQDHNVTARTTWEMYYALRRLGKNVVWVNYMNGGHGGYSGGSEADWRDYFTRVLGWFDKYLKAPSTM